MKTKITSVLVFLFLVLGTGYSSAQVTAGSVRFGTSAINSNIHLLAAGNERDTATVLDLDCDGINDVRLYLYNGNLEVDGRNEARLILLNDSFSVCTDTGQAGLIALYNAGDTLCTGAHQWSADTNITLGCYGGFTMICYQQYSTVDKYIAYIKKSTQQIGWIKASFNLMADTLALSVKELLVLCKPEAVSEPDDAAHFNLSPNPSPDGKVKITRGERISWIEVFNCYGQVVKTFHGYSNEIVLPDQGGIYIVRLFYDSGIYFNRKVIRQ